MNIARLIVTKLQHGAVGIGIFMLALSIPAIAKDKDIFNGDRPPIVQKLFDCQLVAEPGERLACFDREMALVAAAEADKSVVIIDNDQIKEAKRGLFGFTLPKIKLFGDSDETEQIKEIDAVLAGASQMANGRWLFTLEDGAKWQQIETRELFKQPKAGSKIHIKSAIFGSYLANLDGQIAIRIKRVN